jgi:hypothetical protein
VAWWLGQISKFRKLAMPWRSRAKERWTGMGVTMEAEEWGRGVLWVLVLAVVLFRDGEGDSATRFARYCH